MKRLLTTLSLIMALAIGSAAQVSSHTAFRIRFGTALPATCSPNTGDVFFKTSAPIGAYQCLVANTFTAFGGSVAPLTVIDANTLAQGNSTNIQTFYIYGTVDSISAPVNYERMTFTYNNVANGFRIATEKGGTGTVRPLDFQTAGTAFRFIDSGGTARMTITSATGVIGTYSNVATAGLGTAPIRGTILASTGLVASLGATTILTGGAATAGLYRVCYQASTTTSGTGTTGTVTIAWNDGNAKSFTTGTWALNAVDATGQVNGCQTFRVAASQNITLATTIAAIGTSVYRADAQVEQMQ